PFDLWRYAGRGASSWGSPNLRMNWTDWVQLCNEIKPQLMEECRAYMDGRFNFSGDVLPGRTMSGGRNPTMKGPTARFPQKVPSWEDLGKLSAAQNKKRDVFPYKPLAHPLQSTAHMVFPEMWLAAHPEHRRIDVDLDFPNEYLPEYPPPMFLT